MLDLIQVVGPVDAHAFRVGQELRQFQVLEVDADFLVVVRAPGGMRFGQAGPEIERAVLRLGREEFLEVGGVIIGDVPTFRSDQMPYGGVKASGVGKEGLLHAMRDLTHERILVLSDLAL